MSKDSPEYTEQRFRLLILNAKFKDRLAEFRATWNIPANEVTEESVERWVNKNIRVDEATHLKYIADIESIYKQFKLPHSYRSLITPYILFNRVDDVFVSMKIQTIVETDDYDEKHLFVEVFPDTTIKDIQKNWTNIEVAMATTFGPRKGRNKPIANFKRDLDIYLFKNQGKTYQEIMDLIREKYGKTPVYDELAKIYKSFNKRIERMGE